MVVHTTMYLDYHTVVVLCYFFLFWQEIVFGVTYVPSVQYSCAVVSFFCFGGKVLLRPEKKIQSSVWPVVLSIIITTGKKRYSRLSGKCAIIITT